MCIFNYIIISGSKCMYITLLMYPRFYAMVQNECLTIWSFPHISFPQIEFVVNISMSTCNENINITQ